MLEEIIVCHQMDWCLNMFTVVISLCVEQPSTLVRVERPSILGRLERPSILGRLERPSILGRLEWLVSVGIQEQLTSNLSVLVYTNRWLKAYCIIQVQGMKGYSTLGVSQML